MGLYGPQIARRLTVQYRMHEAIMGFSSAEFYDGQLEADTSVRRHLLAELPEVKDTPTTRSPLEFIDTAGASFDEELEPDGESRLNPQEADLTRRKVQELLDCGLPPGRHRRDRPLRRPGAAAAGDAGRAGPGDRQRGRFPGPREGSGRHLPGAIQSQGRDRLPGRRAADERGPDPRQRKLLVIGDSATLAGEPFYQRMIEYFEGLGAYKTVWEEGDA